MPTTKVPKSYKAMGNRHVLRGYIKEGKEAMHHDQTGKDGYLSRKEIYVIRTGSETDPKKLLVAGDMLFKSAREKVAQGDYQTARLDFVNSVSMYKKAAKDCLPAARKRAERVQNYFNQKEAYRKGTSSSKSSPNQIRETLETTVILEKISGDLEKIMGTQKKKASDLI